MTSFPRLQAAVSRPRSLLCPINCALPLSAPHASLRSILRDHTSQELPYRAISTAPRHKSQSSTRPQPSSPRAVCRLSRHKPLPLTERRSLSLILPPCRSNSSAAILTEPPNPSPTPYAPPKRGLLSLLPPSWVPYAELIRLDKPTGTYYLFFPCLFSTLLAAPLSHPITPPSDVLTTTLLFLSGALIMRGAGCTINDLWDRNLDPHVARTRLRPIARGAVTPFSALAFTGVQLLAGLGILVQFPTACLYYGIPSLLFVAAYPLAKRVTYYPQFVLGLTFSWGAIMGFPALGIDLLSSPAALSAAACLYSSNVAWTVLYDIVYAHMDVRDDHKAGIKSMAIRHEKNTRAILSGLAATQVALLAGAGLATGAGPVYFAGTCGTAAASLAVMIWRVNLKSVDDCWWWFRYGCWFTGGGITAGLLGEYMANLLGWYEEEVRVMAVATEESHD